MSRHFGLAAAAIVTAGVTMAGFTLVAGRAGNDAPPAAVAGIGGPFALTDQVGARFTDADLKGKPAAIFFGFTLCPDVCPTTLYELSGAMQELGPDADRLNVVFVSVDWERDGPAQLARYMAGFDDRFIGLSGKKDEIEAAAKAFGVHVERVATGDGYTMDHTASVFLVDGDGRLFGTLSYDEAHETKLAKLRRLVASARPGAQS